MKRKLLVNQFALLLFMLFGIGTISAQGVFISQNCDPKNNYVADRFAEIYNPTDAAVDLTGWTLENVQNGAVKFTWTLSGTIAAGQALVCGNADATGQTITPNFTATWAGTSFNGKGGDGTILKNASGAVVDSAVQNDATGKFENGHMVRNPDIGTPTATYDASQWTFSSILDAVDAKPGDHTYNGGSNTQPPSWTTNFPKVTQIEDTRATLLANLDKAGKVYFIVVAKDATAPTAAEVKAGADYGSVTVLTKDTIDVAKANETTSFNLTGAQPNTSTDIWFVAEDNAGNLQSSPVKISVTTTGARSLSFDNPKANDSYNLGDTIKLEWTSSNIDSLIVTIRPASSFITVVMTDGPFAAAAGSYNLIIPKEAMAGDYSLVLHDYYDTTFKQSVSPVTVVDNRTLQMIKPKDNDTVYVGDTLTFKWTSTNIDSVLIGGYIGGGNGPDGGYFMLTGDIDHFDTATFRPIAAASGVWKMYLDPNNMGGSIKLDSVFIWDAADMHLKDYASPVYIVDTFPMRISHSMPEFGMNDFMPGSGINADFNCDSIIRGTGNLYLKKANGTVVQTISADSIELQGSGISFMPHPGLVPGQSYYIEIDSGFVKCADGGKTFPGLTNKDWSFTVASSSLYFSEYIEGSGNNKALEIYNPTDHDISLDDYIIAGSYNGSGIDQNKDVYHFPKGYVLKSGQVFVVANNQSDTAILAHTNDTVAYNEGGYVCSFNGNDARVLIKQVSQYNRMWIDAIGNPWDNPGSGWDVAGVTAATKDHTLLRKSNVIIGNGGNWGNSAGSNANDSQWIVKDKNYFGNIGFPTPTGNSQSDIESVLLMNKNKDNVTVSTRIVQNKDSVYVTVLSGTDVTQMYGKFEVSSGAEIHPDSTNLLDFTNPLQFTVRAQNGIDSTVWTIAVSVAASQSSEANITSFSIKDAMAVSIDDSAHAVTVMMPFGVNATALSPEITVSAGATVSPASGVTQDFTRPVVYTVTAQNGTTLSWTVTVIIATTKYVSIHDIQYTTDPSGDSPYKGQVVTTSGVVTALNVYKGVRKGYYIEDTAAAWNGVYVYDTDTTNHVMAVGDSVKITGMVDEYNNLTEIKSLQDFNNLGSGYTRLPVDVTTGTYSSEQWESVLAKFVNATCTNADLGHGEVEVNDGAGAGVLDDYLFPYDSTFVLNNVYTVTGIVNYYYSTWTLNPRDAADISNVTGISNNSLADNISIYPNPGNGRLNLRLNNTMKGNVTVRVMDITGRVVYRHVFNNVMSQQLLNIDISNKSPNLYFISISDAQNTVVRKFMKR